MHLQYILLSTDENRVRAWENLKEKTDIFFFPAIWTQQTSFVIKYRQRWDVFQHIVGMHLQTSQGPSGGYWMARMHHWLVKLGGLHSWWLHCVSLVMVNDHVFDLTGLRTVLQDSVLSWAPASAKKANNFSTATHEIVHMTPMWGRAMWLLGWMKVC